MSPTVGAERSTRCGAEQRSQSNATAGRVRVPWSGSTGTTARGGDGDIRQLDGRVDGLTTEVSDLRAEARRGFMRMEARFEQQLVRSGASDRALDDRVTALEVRMDRVDPPKD